MGAGLAVSRAEVSLGRQQLPLVTHAEQEDWKHMFRAEAHLLLSWRVLGELGVNRKGGEATPLPRALPPQPATA